MSLYDAAIRSEVTLAEARAVVGKRASLTFTGRIVCAGESAAGTYIKFELDPRFGFLPGERFVMDLDPFVVES